MLFYTRFRADMQKYWSVNNLVKCSISSEACHWYLWWCTLPYWHFVFYIQKYILPGENILDIPLINLIYHVTIPLINTEVFPIVILIQMFYWVMRKNWSFSYCVKPIFDQCSTYAETRWKSGRVEEWHFASKNQLPGLSVGEALVENELISQIFLLILSS